MAEKRGSAQTDIRRIAEEAGLERLTPGQLEEFEDGLRSLRGMIEKLDRDFAPADEPAHVFRAGPEA